jgi:hypothetical protein
MRFYCLLGLAGVLLPVGSLDALQPADKGAIARELSILECGISAFSDADDQFLGRAYGLRGHSRSRTAPDARDRLRDDHEDRIAACGRLHHLNANELDTLDQFTWVEVLRRGAAWNLRDAGIDPAKLDAIARTLSVEDITRESNGPLVPRLHRVLAEAGVPRHLHATAVDYMVFRRRMFIYRAAWVQARLGLH